MKKSEIRSFNEINELHQATGFHEKTHTPLFHIFNSKVLKEGFSRSMPPYHQNYYQVGLNKDLTGTMFSLQTQDISEVNNLLFFVSPGQVLTWEVADMTDGFLMYFKEEFFSFHRAPLSSHFPFLGQGAQSCLLLTANDCDALYEELRRLRAVFEERSVHHIERLQGLTLAFLFKCKELFNKYGNTAPSVDGEAHLQQQFMKVLGNFYAQYKTCNEYAEILNVSSRHLRTVIKKASGRSVKDLIDERILMESKNLLKYSQMTVSEIAYKVGFSQPTHFIRFFRKITGATPQQFRSGCRG